MKSFKAFLFLLLFGAPWLSGAAPFCFDLLGTSDRAQTEFYLEQRLEPFLDQIPVKLSEKLVSKFAKKLHQRKVSELDFHNLSLKFYKALKGPFYKDFVRGFSNSRSTVELERVHEFYRTLQDVTKEFAIVPHETAWIRMRMRLIDNESLISWAQFVSAQSAAMWATYQISGQILPLPVMIPTWTSLQFKRPMTNWQKTSAYYNQSVKTWHSAVTAVTLAAFILMPHQNDEIVKAVHEEMQTVEKHQQDVIKANQSLFNSSDFAKRTHSLTEEVDAMIATHKAEQKNK